MGEAEEEGRGEKDRVGSKDLREEGRVLVTHCSGNSSGQGVVGYASAPRGLEVDLNRDLKQTKYRRGPGIFLVCLITHF